jgi:mRNA interferase HigB
MWIISRKKLLEAVERHADLMGPLKSWYQITKGAEWSSLTEVRQTFSSADAVGSCTVFNIKGNAYRLVTWINFATHKVFIRHVLTHAEYSKGGWKDDCFGN